MITCFPRNIFLGSSSILHLEKRASLLTCAFRGSFFSEKPLFPRYYLSFSCSVRSVFSRNYNVSGRSILITWLKKITINIYFMISKVLRLNQDGLIKIGQPTLSDCKNLLTTTNSGPNYIICLCRDLDPFNC